MGPSRNASIALGVLLAAGVFLLCAFWSAAVPRGRAPDEPDHLAMIEFVGEHGRLPRYGESEFTVALMATNLRRVVARPGNLRGLHQARAQGHPLSLRQPYVFLPQLPYALAGHLYRMTGGRSLGAARAFDALCIAAAALATYVAGLALWPGRRLAAFVAGACLGLWPQITFLGAYANDDAFAFATSTVLVATCAVLQARAFDRRAAIAFGLACGLVGAAKPYALALLPLAAVWLAGILRAALRTGVLDARAARRRLAWAVAAFAVVVAPWAVRNALLYEGDPTGRRVLRREMRAFIAELPPAVTASANLLDFKPDRARPRWTQFRASFFRDTAASAWARFGWMDIVPPGWVVRSGHWVLGIGIAASLVVFFGRRPRRFASSPWIFGLPGLALLCLGAVANAWLVDFQPQGRYLLPCAGALVLQITSLGAGASPGTGRIAARRTALVTLLAFFLAQNLYCRLTVLG